MLSPGGSLLCYQFSRAVAQGVGLVRGQRPFEHGVPVFVDMGFGVVDGHGGRS